MTEPDRTAARYRKLPVEIEAIHFDGTPESILAVMHFVDAGRTTKELKIRAESDPAKSWIGIPTLEGTMRADSGDWIVRGVKGELYPVKPDIFATTYEPATEPAVQSPADRAATPTDWIDGHPQLEAIAAAVWEQCGRSDSGACVEDDPRNIAVAALAALPEPAGRAAVYAEVADRLAADAEQGDKDGLTRIYRRSAARQVRAWGEELAGEQPAPLRAEFTPFQLLADQPDEPLPQTERVVGGRRLMNPSITTRPGDATVDPAMCPRCKGDNSEAFQLCAKCAPDRLRCPQCGEDITDYDEDDHVFRTGDERPYCSGECVIAAHRAAIKRPPMDPVHILGIDAPAPPSA